ncbi:MAG: ABC transporter permease, partial [Novosphingobium sp.]
MSENRTLLGTVLRNPVGLAAIAWLVIASLAMMLAPWLTLHDPLEQDLLGVLTKPSAAHLFGTDALGRDIFSRVLHGGRSTLVAAAEALAVYLAAGVTLGLMAGYLGGWVDWAASRLAELLIAMPTIIIVLVVLAVFPGNMDMAMGCIGFIASAGLIRILRAQAMAYREELYVAAAAVAGLTRGQIMLRHIAPRVMSTIIVQGSLLLAAAVSAQAGLGFLGFGAPPPEPSWGGLIHDASQVISRAPWMLVSTGAPLILTVLALGLLGDVIRDAAVQGWSVPKLARTAQLR